MSKLDVIEAEGRLTGRLIEVFRLLRLLGGIVSRLEHRVDAIEQRMDAANAAEEAA